MATPQDGAAGYRLYLDSEGTLAIAEINDWLTGHGYAPVSSRMFRHFQTLYRLSYTSYLPINRLDVLTSQDPVWDPKFRVNQAATTEEPVSLSFRAGTETIRVHGVATEMSEFGFLAVLNSEALAPVLEKASVASPSVSATFGDGQRVTARLIGWSVNRRRGQGRARFVFQEFGALDRLDPVVNTALVRFDLNCGTVSTTLLIGEAAQLTFWAHQALEAARLAAEMLTGQRIPHPVLQQLRFGSEWQVVGDGAAEMLRVFGLVFALLKSPGVVLDALNSWEDLQERRDQRRERRDPETKALQNRQQEATARQSEADAGVAELQLAEMARPPSEAEDDRPSGRSLPAAADSLASDLFGLPYRELSDQEKSVVLDCLQQLLRSGRELTRIASPVRFSTQPGDASRGIPQVTLDPNDTQQKRGGEGESS